MDSIIETLVQDVFIPVIIVFTIILFVAITLIAIFTIVGLLLYKKGKVAGNSTQKAIGMIFLVLAGITTTVLLIILFR